MAGDLVQVHREFSSKGVLFLSVTTDNIADVQSFVEQNHITWPNAIIARESVKTLKVQVAQNASAIAPTLLVTSPAGIVLWSDTQDRFEHNTDGWANRLRSVLVKELAVRNSKNDDR